MLLSQHTPQHSRLGAGRQAGRGRESSADSRPSSLSDPGAGSTCIPLGTGSSLLYPRRPRRRFRYRLPQPTRGAPMSPARPVSPSRAWSSLGDEQQASDGHSPAAWPGPAAAAAKAAAAAVAGTGARVGPRLGTRRPVPSAPGLLGLLGRPGPPPLIASVPPSSPPQPRPRPPLPFVLNFPCRSSLGGGGRSGGARPAGIGAWRLESGSGAAPAPALGSLVLGNPGQPVLLWAVWDRASRASDLIESERVEIHSSQALPPPLKTHH